MPARPGATAGRVREEAAALARDAVSPWVRAQAAALALPPGLPWVEAVRQGLGVEPRLTPLDALAERHDRLRRLLPGSGPLGPRLAAVRTAALVPADALSAVVRDALALLRVDEPGDEGVDVRLVDAGPGAGLRGAGLRALGSSRSQLLLVRRPLTRAGLLGLLAHETWPGHHLERLRARDRPHRAASVLGTPEAVVSEGLAETALRVSGVSVRELGAGAREHEVAAVAGPLAALVRADAVVLLHTRGPAAAAGHLARWGLLEPDRVQAQLAFAGDPRYAVHAAAYGAGARLVGAVLDAAPDPVAAHRALQRADVLPADLRP